MNRKPSGFWSRKEVRDLLRRYVSQVITLEQAAAEIQTMCKEEGVNQSLDELREDVRWYARGIRREQGLLPPAKSEGVTIRLSPLALEAFRALARRTSRSVSSVVSEAAEEALRMRQHSGIVFAGSPGNRRARLESGPDVWEVAALFKLCGEDLPRTQQALSHLTPGQVEAALRYYRAHPDEINRLIEENERPVGEWQRQYPHIVSVAQVVR